MHGHQITPIKIVIFDPGIDVYIASQIKEEIYTTWLLFPFTPIFTTLVAFDLYSHFNGFNMTTKEGSISTYP